jgi:hypothetical protein
MPVPAGEDRTFSVLVNTRYLTFRGDTTVDLTAGQDTTVVVEPELAATAIVVPDPYSEYNYTTRRLVQIEDMSGTGWTVVNFADLGLGMSSINEFIPYDVDFDAHGRIYVANSYAGIVRIDDMSAANALWFATGLPLAATPVTCIAVARNQGWIYFTGGSDLKRLPVANPTGSPDAISLTGLFPSGLQIYGMGADTQGYLYLVAYSYSTYQYGVYKIDAQNPGSPSFAATPYADAGVLSQPRDVMIKDSFAYVTNQLGADGAKILQLTKQLQFVRGFGGPAPSLPAAPKPGEFYGPRLFVATLNRKITVIDEDDQLTDRLVAFDDMEGLNWVTYGSSGSGVGQFGFFQLGE